MSSRLQNLCLIGLKPVAPVQILPNRVRERLIRRLSASPQGASTLVQPTTTQVETVAPAPIPLQLTAEHRRWLTASPHSGGSADVAGPISAAETETPGVHATGELDSKRAAALQAIWSLLEEMGYEIW